ncbi:MAG: acyl-CoA dehydrogenase [Gammaproteobacteria bacterium]
MAFWEVLILLMVVVGLAFVQVPVILWTLVIGLVLFLVTVFGTVSYWLLAVCWLIFLAAALFANLTNTRQKYFTKPIVTILQKRMPAISDTEREAIEAGDVWFEKDLFCGRPQWKKFLAIPQPKLSTDEQNFLENQVETLCKMLNDWQIISDSNLPPEVWDYLKLERFFGLVIPKEYGGRGFSAIAHSTIVTKIATRSMSTAVNTMVPNSLGPAELLLHYGTPEQKDYYLPRLARGEEMPCFALTGPEAGSDAGSMTDTGIVCYGDYQGKEVLGVRLTWDKRYITLAPIATVLGLAFRLYDPDHLLSEKENIGITLCLVPTNHPGVEIGRRHLPMHLAFLNGPTFGTDVFIPIDWIIGGAAMAGEGWRMLMECLSVGRGISLPALSTACGKLAYRHTGAYARIRKQFNTSISNFEGIEEALGEIAGLTYLLESCRMMTAGAIDLKIKPAIATAIAKFNMTEMARKVMAHAMDIEAGHGIQVGPRNLIAHPYMAIPVSITVEGANILTRNLIIFGQGAIRCHPYILQEVELFAATNTPDRIEQLDKLLLSHMGYVVSNMARNLCCGISGGKLLFSPVRGPTARYYRQLTRMSSALALLSDVTMMILGGELKRKERISARLGDILSQLYLASAALKYFHDNGQAIAELDTLKWSVETCLHAIQTACDELLNNFPISWLGKVLRWFIFPFGTAYHRPKDNLYRKITAPMFELSEFRDRLTRYTFLSKEPIDTSYQLEEALTQIAKIDPIAKKFQNALRSGTLPVLGSFDDRALVAVKTGLLTEDEVRALREYNALHKEVIKVDEFSFDLNTVLS